MQKLYKKLRYLTFCIVFATFILAPIHITHAEFSDSTTQTAGIKLELGNIDLAVKDSSNNRIVDLEKNQKQIQLKETVQNKGSLNGKLAYRVLFKNTITKEIKIQKDYVLLTDNSDGDSLNLNPGASQEVSINVDISPIQNQIEITEVQIEFLLFQTNGTLEKPMFHDEITMIYNLILDKEDGEVVIPPENGESNDYWPTTGWIDHGNIRYNKEEYSPIMYFSEIAGTSNQQIKNLNDSIFYIEVKNKKGIDLAELTIRSPEDMTIRVEHVNENKQHLKITISIDKTKFQRKILSVPIYDYSIASYHGNNFELSEEDEPITLKRILLSTDEAGSREFKTSPISLFGETREISLTQTQEDNTLYLHEVLTEIDLNKKTAVYVEVSGENKELVNVKKDQSTTSQFTLQPKNSSSTQIEDIELAVLLKGNSGEVLEVKRDIQLMPVIQESMWPQYMDKEWGIPDKTDKYNQTVSIDLIENKGKMISKNEFFIYVKNLYKEELHFSMSDSSNYIVQNIGYNSSGDYMRIALKFISSDLNEYNFPWGFNFSIQREISTKHINSVEVRASYHKMTVAAQPQLEITLQERSNFVAEFNIEQQIIQPLKNSDTELYIYYDQLVSDYDLVNFKEEILDYLNDHNSTLTFELEDDPNSKAVKLIIQK
ncbi:hypothetical protein JTF06_05410 [Desemzia sp. RIT804]|uniref:hypothetical protein n=1 Tax=Desemzia sp. RIT 804 TaxID=2810209 RepID=UPI00194F5B5C|nr:hypothetical protein [Desemzia sp. RIT 804]MBM6614324.1 hypothetical protein [Desemzia sp. RIT 804]